MFSAPLLVQTLNVGEIGRAVIRLLHSHTDEQRLFGARASCRSIDHNARDNHCWLRELRVQEGSGAPLRLVVLPDDPMHCAMCSLQTSS